MVIYYGTIRKKETPTTNKSWAIKLDLYLPTPQRVHERGKCVGSLSMMVFREIASKGPRAVGSVQPP